MILVEHRTRSGTLAPGLLAGDRVIDLGAVARQLGVAAPAQATDLLGAGAITYRALIEAAPDATDALVPEPRLGPAVCQPGKILCLAGNYQAHIEEAGQNRIDKARSTPRVFIKPNSAIIGTGEAIRVPEVSDTVDYEIEIAAVIGRGGSSIPLADVPAHIGGYVVFNDISARQITGTEHRAPRPMDDFFDWLIGKWCDTFAVVGPHLVTADEIPDPAGLEMALHVNGELRQHSSAGEMIFSVSEAVAWISRFLTLEPGDLICMGTPGGVGDASATYLTAGDTVTASIEGLGTLENPVT
jgi:2-keto-4-pentenoate hydratase/2-oxohepta-3-ene-1,7-dioic acid hydratase in catechol pathway